MADKVGDEYEGYITGVAAFGLFIELIEHYVEGLVHVSSMADDYYRFVEQQHVMLGENTKKVYRLGDKYACRSCALTWSAGRSNWAWWRFLIPCGVTSAGALRHAASSSIEEGTAARAEARERPGPGGSGGRSYGTSRLPYLRP